MWPVFALSGLFFFETGGILGPNLTKLVLPSGLHICMIRPLCIKSAVETP